MFLLSETQKFPKVLQLVDIVFLEETVFWTEEVENEILRWADEKNKLAEVENCFGHINFLSYSSGEK